VRNFGLAAHRDALRSTAFTWDWASWRRGSPDFAAFQELSHFVGRANGQGQCRQLRDLPHECLANKPDKLPSWKAGAAALPARVRGVHG
jgi:hypothetical protein